MKNGEVKDDLVQDMMEVLTSFGARLYGRRSAKNRARKALEVIERNRAYRYELDPNVQPRILLAKHAGAARFAYNWGLARRMALWEQERKRTDASKQHRELNVLEKTDFPWMY